MMRFVTMGIAAAVTAGHANAIFFFGDSYDPIQVDQLFTFDNLAPGAITDGLQIAPGVQFSTDSQGDLGSRFLANGGRIVDTGNGDIQLAYTRARTAALEGFMIRFDTPITALAATWTTAGGNSDDGNAAWLLYNAQGELVHAFSTADFEPTVEIFGAGDLDEAITYVEFSNGQRTSNEDFLVNDLAVTYIPSPASASVLGIAALAATRRRR
ncbi:MAG: hypothetical protein AAGB34_01955 [Planctomycetota bacterium]